MGLKVTAIILIIISLLCFYTEHILSCNVTSLEPCPGNNHFCNQTSLECECIEGYYKVGDECQNSYTYYISSRDSTAIVTMNYEETETILHSIR
ncbi:unnamed protein product [Parnassius apollo]|uniref:(apollo) hypothetical protein n=1 Tax=Parnassius apollo TaxID=110799 RepID=A0A8S3XTY1_PARAO|nr:unnamed protein product [Parnassius apollo]